MKTTIIKNGKKLIATLAVLTAVGVLGGAFLIRSGGNEGDQPQRSIVIAVTRTATPAPEDTAEAPAVVEKDPAAEPTSPPEDTGEAPQVQPEPTIDQGEPAPTQIPVTPVATPEPVTPVATPTVPAPSPTPGACQNCPTPTLGLAPSQAPVFTINDFFPPVFESGYQAACFNKTVVHVWLDAEAKVWVEYYITDMLVKAYTQLGTSVFFILPANVLPHDIVVHAEDESGNHATFVPPVVDC